MRFRAVMVVPVAALAAACGSSSSTPSGSTSPATTPTSGSGQHVPPGLSTRKVGGLGTILVNQNGRTLYTFAPEKGGKVACTGSCATTWPPLTTSGQTPSVSSALVHPNLVSSVANPSGGKIVTYAGWPLRTYTSDTAAGDVKGQGVSGQWYVISPSGQVITRSASSPSGSGSHTY